MKKCQCKSCGKEFEKGSEGDNEKICLRCERLELLDEMDDCEYEEMDIQESSRKNG